MTSLRKIILVLLIAAVASVASAQDTPDQFSGDLALQYVGDQMAVGPHPAASQGLIEAGDVILNQLDGYGWTTSEDWHVVNLGNRSAFGADAQKTLDLWQPLEVGTLLTDQLSGATDRPINFDPVIVPVRNLVASTGSGNTIIIGAHYDSRLFADHDSDPAKQFDPVPAANDGGSGVAVLLEMARVISEYYTPNQEIRLVFFDAEDNGHIEPWASLLPQTNGFLIGSALYANTLGADANVDYMVLVDMVGDMDQKLPIEGYSNQVAPDLTNAIWATAANLGYGEQFSTTPRSAITDDHVPFIQLGIPAVDIIDLDYPYWHTAADTLDKVSADSLERVGRTLIAYLEQTGAITRKG